MKIIYQSVRFRAVTGLRKTRGVLPFLKLQSWWESENTTVRTCERILWNHEVMARGHQSTVTNKISSKAEENLRYQEINLLPCWVEAVCFVIISSIWQGLWLAVSICRASAPGGFLRLESFRSPGKVYFIKTQR